MCATLDLVRHQVPCRLAFDHTRPRRNARYSVPGKRSPPHGLPRPRSAFRHHFSLRRAVVRPPRRSPAHSEQRSCADPQSHNRPTVSRRQALARLGSLGMCIPGPLAGPSPDCRPEPALLWDLLSASVANRAGCLCTHERAAATPLHTIRQRRHRLLKRGMGVGVLASPSAIGVTISFS